MQDPRLTDLGWSAFEFGQLDLTEISLAPARIAEVHRSRVHALAAEGLVALSLPPTLAMSDLAVGDWVLTEWNLAEMGPNDPAHAEPVRLRRRLDRRSVLIRRAAGTAAAPQAIAANVDTLFVVTSCNADFSEPRLERYLALAHEAGVQPVVVLTKADLCDDPGDYIARASNLSPGLVALAVDARDPAALAGLAAWCSRGRTVALLGSSGVGKTTLINALAGTGQATAPIRAHDGRGRHTTTARTLHPLPGGGWLIDTPGMRELRLSDVAEGIDATFAEVTEIALGCRFGDCSHGDEPGCAVQAAIAEGRLDPGRLARWQKLRREERHNAETLHEARSRFRATGRMHRGAKRQKLRLNGLEED